MPDPQQMYALKIIAMGEIRDADGNLISQEPVEAVQVLTEAEVLALIEGAPSWRSD